IHTIMDRRIKFSEIRDAVNAAYEEYKSLKEGTADSRVGASKHDTFGISVALADGTVINKGDSDAQFPIGQILRIPVASILLAQNGVDNLLKKSGVRASHCNGKDKKPKMEFSPRMVRAVSAIEPTGDFDSKWNFVENRMIDLMGSAPQLDLKLYENLKQQAAENKTAEQFGEDGYYLYDDAFKSLDLLLKGMSMRVSAQQLAEMGATIAADGVNPFTRKIVFDGALSQRIVGMMAQASRRVQHAWLVKAGLPAVTGFGGGVVGVIPGVMAIAAYSPELNERGTSVKAANALQYIMNKLQLSVFGSAKVVVEQ
ncbi:MAG: glutaminase, partial [Muribaculaceae bacterium]|nr:glutaminase [Muribaculaceae bacterium]